MDTYKCFWALSCNIAGFKGYNLTFVVGSRAISLSYIVILFYFFLLCTGGNQRELARQKNAKKQTDMGKGKRGDDGLSAAARKQR